MEKTTIERGEKLMNTLNAFKIKATLSNIIEGATVTIYEIKLETGIKLSKLKNLTNDLELNLSVNHVRIVPIPEKMSIGIEVPSVIRKTISFNEIINVPCCHKIPFFLGKDILGNTISIDVSYTPHLLIGGATGSGKSVCINNLICSIIKKCSPDEVRLVLVDPKRVELSYYASIPHLIGNVITDVDDAIAMLDGLIKEMNRRYELLEIFNVRNIDEYNYNALFKLKYIVVIMDEFADFMASSQSELEPRIAKLTAMARAVGIHLVLATQRPSADVVTGLIKANIPSRISFQVSSSINSRIILDSSGAEKLIGKGDMLLSLNTRQDLVRIQGAYLSDNDIKKIVGEVKRD